jgi:3-deoxy-D-manno-octulosonic acid (KDO) 8-phosphate synthase
MMKQVEIACPKGGSITIANDRKLTFIAGPCQLESAPWQLR